MTKDEALKLALEALELHAKQYPHMQKGYTVDAITAIREALEQPEQEPVAWKNAALRVGEDLCSVGPFGYYDMTAEQWLDWALSVVTVHAPPAQRTWVGLTDAQRKALLDARNKAMEWALKGRVPECGEFAAIAQDLDYLCDQLAIRADPAQRTWVGLTDEEIWKFWWSRPEVQEGEDDSMEAEFVAAVRRVLAAHGIRENT